MRARLTRTLLTRYIRTFGQSDRSSVYNSCRAKSDIGCRNAVDNLRRLASRAGSTLAVAKHLTPPFQRGYCHARLLNMPTMSWRTLAFRLLAAVAVAALIRPVAAVAQDAADLELIIAVDVSLSMDLDEQRLQRDGYVAAFRDPEVHKAIPAGAHGRIAVAYLEWAGPPNQQVVIPWT